MVIDREAGGAMNVALTHRMRFVLTAVMTSLALAGIAAAQGSGGLTKNVAQQEMRAVAGLPVPTQLVTVSDTIEFERSWVATVDFASTPAHVKFRRSGEKWIPAEMSYQGGWIPLSKGFAIISEHDENGAKSWLRTIASGQLTYSAVCANGFFAPTLAALAAPERGQSEGFILKEMVPPRGSAVLIKDHYDIAMTAAPSSQSPRSCNGVPAGGSAQTWSATARRHKGFAGKSFKVDADGTLIEIK